MKIKKCISDLFYRLCYDAVIGGLQVEINNLKLNLCQKEKQYEGIKHAYDLAIKHIQPCPYPIYAKVIRLSNASFCFQDMYEMTKHPRSWYKRKPELKAGTDLIVENIWSNFYGTFFKCKIPEGIEIDKGCIPTYDIPIYNAQVIEWEYPEE